MKTLIQTFAIALMVFGISSGASSADKQTVAEFLEQELETVDLYAQDPGHLVAGESNWTPAKNALRIRGKFGLSLPGLAKFQIVPFVDFYWAPAKKNKLVQK